MCGGGDIFLAREFAKFCLPFVCRKVKRLMSWIVSRSGWSSAGVRFGQKRTFAVQNAMSAMGQ